MTVLYDILSIKEIAGSFSVYGRVDNRTTLLDTFDTQEHAQYAYPDAVVVKPLSALPHTAFGLIDEDETWDEDD